MAFVSSTITQSDQGSYFTTKQMQQWTLYNNITWVFTYSYCPKRADIIERHNELLKQELLKDHGGKWSSKCQK